MPPVGLAVGVDVGGTKVAAGLVAADGSVLSRTRRQTPADDARAVVDLIAELAVELAEAQGLRGVPVGVGIPGLVDRDGVARYLPNVALRNHPLRAELAGRLGVAVTVDNDANVAAWGEYRAGAGLKAVTSLLMLTLGTGVGGGLVQEDRLIRGAAGLGAEFGHILVREGGRQCPCGNRGCLEAYASGTAIGLTAVEALAAGDVPADSMLIGATAVTGTSVTVAAHAGDRFGADVLARCGFWLGVGIASLVNALDPEIVVLGGGAMEAGELILAPARDAFAERLLGAEHRTAPPIVRAQLGDDAGVVGAALRALDAQQAGA
jgi:glucokinase